MDKRNYTKEEINYLKKIGSTEEQISFLEQHIDYSKLILRIKEGESLDEIIELLEIDIEDEEEEKQNKKEISEYESSYKNILWIDDRDDKDASPDKLEWMERYLQNPKSMSQIDQEDSFFEAANKIINSYQYDLVIFDINLSKCFDDIHKDENEQELEKIFKKCCIRFKYSDISGLKEQKTAGIYLYLLLLSTGYPIERMVIYTGNNEGSTNDKTRISFLGKANELASFIDFEDKDNTILKLKTNERLNVESYFNKKENLYYRIRRLVFQACNHWKEWLKDIEIEEEKSKAKEEKSNTEKIPFNRIYFSKKTEQQISPESFVEMLDRVKMLFPVVQPSKTEQVYYQALQMVAMLHEESADIRKTKNLFCYPWHSMIRNFRNWSAHNKLGEASIDGEQFALLFCVALRTFFDEKQKTEFSGLYRYEEVFDFTCTYGESGHMETKIFSITNENLGRTLHKNWNELFNIGWADASCLSGGLSKLTYSIPQNVKKTLKKKHLFIPIWCTYYDKNEKDNRIKDSINVTKECASDFSKLEDSVSIFYKWEPKEDILNNTCAKAEMKNLTPEAVFMRYCYRWLTEE